MTQKDLADAVGVSAAWMSQIEREIKEPSLAIGLELAKVLECDADDLIN